MARWGPRKIGRDGRADAGHDPAPVLRLARNLARRRTRVGWYRFRFAVRAADFSSPVHKPPASAILARSGERQAPVGRVRVAGIATACRRIDRTSRQRFGRRSDLCRGRTSDSRWDVPPDPTWAVADVGRDPDGALFAGHAGGGAVTVPLFPRTSEVLLVGLYHSAEPPRPHC